jgi:uncharacterized delta-60 repeat protein
MRKSLIVTCVAFALSAMLAPSVGAASRAGTLDRSFGGGLFLHGFGLEAGSAGASEAVLQPDGKAIVLVAGPFGYSLGRLTAAGAADPGFGSGGYLAGDFGKPGSTAVDVALQPDGKVLVAGALYASRRFAVTRYTAEGQVDPGFGEGGTAYFAGGPEGEVGSAGGLLVQPDGKILVSGIDVWASQPQLEVARFHGDGTIDRSFGKGGAVAIAVGRRYGNATRQELALHEGRLVVGAEGDPLTLLARFGADGSLDRSFGGDGTVTTGDNSRGMDVAVQPDGRIVVMGNPVARLLPDGSPDPGFGAGGSVQLAEKFEPKALALQPDGRLLIGGSMLEETSFLPLDFALARLNPDGGPDSGFGSGGYVATDIAGGQQDEATALTALPDGGALLLGQSHPAAGYDRFITMAAARYGPDGDLNPSFGAGGILNVSPLTAAVDKIFDLVIDEQGGVIATGRGAGKVATTRFLPNGAPDLAFGNGGNVITEITGTPYGEQGRSVVRYPDGRLLVGAGSAVGGALLRYLPNGSPDPGFGDGGKVLTPAMDSIFELALDRQGRIVAAGVGFDPCELVLARFDANGNPDPTFAGGAGAVQRKVAGACRVNVLTMALAPGGRIFLAGKGRYGFLAAFTPAGERIKGFGRRPGGPPSWRLLGTRSDIEVDPKGRLLVAGSVKKGFGLVRLRPGGTADPSFGREGLVRTPIRRRAQIVEVRVQPDGKILAAGNSWGCQLRQLCPGSVAVTRYNGDGSLDRSFGRRGVWLKRVAFGAEANALALGKGTAVIGGSALASRESYQFLLARLNAPPLRSGR